jgi:N-methylhydantoinase A/oxoprolinase/acetone carboxylase beta subunit
MDNFLLIGIDIGGAFTDAVTVLRIAKGPSHPTDPGQAVKRQRISMKPLLAVCRREAC